MEAAGFSETLVPELRHIPEDCGFEKFNYSETSIHHFCQGSEKETMDPGKQ
jgi:hypothetical protein